MTQLFQNDLYDENINDMLDYSNSLISSGLFDNMINNLLVRAETVGDDVFIMENPHKYSKVSNDDRIHSSNIKNAIHKLKFGSWKYELDHNFEASCEVSEKILKFPLSFPFLHALYLSALNSSISYVSPNSNLTSQITDLTPKLHTTFYKKHIKNENLIFAFGVETTIVTDSISIESLLIPKILNFKYLTQSYFNIFDRVVNHLATDMGYQFYYVSFLFLASFQQLIPKLN